MTDATTPQTPKDPSKPLDSHASGAEAVTDIQTMDSHASSEPIDLPLPPAKPPVKPVGPQDSHASGEPLQAMDSHASSEPFKP
ncbi:hypothetical protein ACFXPW_32600 [Streptomyces goshikiensis]|uniref:hypothetical protein n=1 Tax=Streptomyces goshikiensis TaxID=1942 RepID=UPI0036889E4A